MKASVYKLTQGVFLADLAGQRVMRGTVEDLAAALFQAGLTADDLLLGDWREDAELLTAVEQTELRQAMTSGQAAAGQAFTAQTPAITADQAA
ncbi:hypothetical protein [Acidocella sp.]|uniref:hypothetical protein n=1 Tax=Acidocella sp. TaxID=50710 RepID=UPI00183919C4|nr:hypothetical protein [Acidocella sp.]NNM56487.1 hypothetical protein [Acidocella sp.]